MNENYNDCHQRKTTRTFLYTKRKKLRKVYIYIQKAGQFAKSKTISVTFLYTKSMTFIKLMQFFLKILKLAFIYKKHDTLRDVTFLYSKSQTLRKNQDNLLILGFPLPLNNR